jgi:type I restriction enzyme, S subunit
MPNNPTSQSTTKTPKLRFPQFTGAWEEKKLGDIATFLKGKGISKSDIVEDGILECIRYGELYTHYKEVIRNIKSKTNLDPNGLILSKINDVIIPASGETKEDIATASCVLKGNVALSGDLNIIRTDLNGIFLSFILNNSKKDQISSLAQGVSVVHLYQSQLQGLLIPTPSIPEQTKIAEFLTAVDDKITLLDNQKKQLELYKKGLLQSMFPGSNNRGGGRTIRFLDIGGVSFPDWAEKRLGEVAKKIITKNKLNQIKKVLTNSASFGIVNQRDFFDKDIANINNLTGYYIVEKDDFIYNPRISNFAPVGPVGRNKLQKGIMSPLYTVFRFEMGNLDFYQFYYSTTIWHSYLESIANYGARADRMNITSDGFFSMPISLPTLPEQTKIADFLTSINDKIAVANDQITATKLWKKGLLQSMMV